MRREPHRPNPSFLQPRDVMSTRSRRSARARRPSEMRHTTSSCPSCSSERVLAPSWRHSDIARCGVAIVNGESTAQSVERGRTLAPLPGHQRAIHRGRRAGATREPARSAIPRASLAVDELTEINATCPRCGGLMVTRSNRSTGERFLGCSKFPGCKGTRPFPVLTKSIPSGPRRARPIRYKLSMGGRPKGVADHSELLVARLIGRNLTPLQGCLVQIAALAIFSYLAWAFIASGLMFAITDVVARWYASQVHIGPPPSPTTLR
jgi:ribosomal protein S27AE